MNSDTRFTYLTGIISSPLCALTITATDFFGFALAFLFGIVLYNRFIYLFFGK